MLKQIFFGLIGLMLLISSASATSSLTIGTPGYSSSVLKDESFTVTASLEAASVSSTITVTITLTDSTNAVSITSAEKTVSFSNAGTQNIQWSVKANNPGTYTNPFTITATANDGGQASPKTSPTSLTIQDRPVLTVNVTQNTTTVSANGYVQLVYTINNIASPEAASATDVNASLLSVPSGWTVITPNSYTISSIQSGGSQSSGYFTVKAPSSSGSYNINLSVVSAQGESITTGWTLEVTSTTEESTPPSSGSGSSGGGGGGGGGGSSGEKYNNILIIEKYDLQISKDALTSYRFTNTKNPIMFVNITGNTSLGIITTSVELLKDTSSLVKTPPDGLVYENANIWVGTAGFATPKNIKEALIKFRINNDRMSTNGVLASDIVLVKWDGTRWIDLETKVLSKDDINTYFEGKTNSFSPFAIVAKTAAGPKPTVATSNPVETPKITATAMPAATKKAAGFGIVIALAGLMAVVLRKRGW